MAAQSIRPLEGKNFCCTGIPAERRKVVAKKIVAMGGFYLADLMTDIRYLIVGRRDSDKFRFVVKNRYDVICLAPDAIDTVYKLWLEGEPKERLDPGLYRLPIFDQMKLCVARIDEKLNRKEFIGPDKCWRNTLHETPFEKNVIQTMLKKNGGEFSDVLSQDLTAVITTETRGKRVEMAREWKIPVVHPIWVHDCVVRGLAIPFIYYNLNPDNDYTKGCNVWSLVVKRNRTNNKVSTAVKRAGSDTVWKLLMISKSSIPNLAPDAEPNVWGDSSEAFSGPTEEEASSDIIPPAPKRRQTSTKSRLFQDLAFAPLGFTNDKKKMLSKVLAANDGRLVTPKDAQTTHVVVPWEDGSQAALALKLLPNELQRRITSGEVKVVSDWFLERSIYNKQLQYDCWSEPLQGMKKLNAEILGRRLRVCISGFTGIELLHVGSLLRKLNFEFEESLTKSRDLLIVNINVFENSNALSKKLLSQTPKEIIKCPYSILVSKLSTTNKIKFAKSNQIPVVSLKFLWEILALSAELSKPYLRFPELSDLRWCVYMPTQPNAITEYTTRMGQAHDLLSESPVKYPSPRKSSSIASGKITGSSGMPISITATPSHHPTSESSGDEGIVYLDEGRS